MSSNKVISYHLTKSKINAKVFIKFLKGLVAEVKEDKHLNQLLKKHQLYFYVDNATSHTSKKVKAYAEENKISLIYVIPYFSVFDSCEYFFCTMKKNHYSTVITNR